LIVLGDGVEGGLGLWRFDAPSSWTRLGPVPAATAIARFGDLVAISGPNSVEVRSARTPAAPGTALPIQWQGLAPTARIGSLARSPNGTVAMATTGDESQSYWLVAVDGKVTPLQPAPSQSFTPLVAWLDDARLLVLTTDNLQASRLAVVDVGARTIEPATALAGVRVFALSQDRRHLAAATESRIYAGPMEAFLGTGQPETVASIDPSTVVWGLAFDDSATGLSMLSGTVAADGQVTSLRETGYTKGSASWTLGFDSPAPFGKALGQVWLP
jgi:hypothetical protein